MPKINKYIDEELAAAESVSGTDKLLITQSGTPKAATITQVAGTVDLTGKADKVATSPAPTDYLAKFDVNGNLAVSTKQESDVGGDISAKADKLLTYIDCSASITSPTLTAAQVSGTVLTNFGQGAEDVQIKLPTAAAGYSFVAVMATAPSGNTWKVTADTNDKIYLDGVAGTDGQSAIVTPSVGNFITFFSFQTGESPDTYDWIAQTGQGTWTAGA